MGIGRDNSRWANVASQVGNGADYYKAGANIFADAMNTAQTALTKHEQKMFENMQAQKDASTAKLFETSGKRKLTEKDYADAGIFDRASLLKSIEAKKLNDARIGSANRANLSLEDQLKKYAVQASIDKKYGRYTGRGSSGKGGKGSKPRSDLTKIYANIDERNWDPTSKREAKKSAYDLAIANVGTNAIMHTIDQGEKPNWFTPNWLGADTGEYQSPSDVDAMRKAAMSLDNKFTY